MSHKQLVLTNSNAYYVCTAGNPLINILVHTAKGVMYLYAVNTSGKRKTGQYIADILSEAIEKIGSAHVTQVLTDSASNCKLAGQLLEAKYPHLTWQPCAGHCLDLFLEYVGEEISGVRDLIAQARKLCYYIKNHQMALDAFKSHASHALLCPAATRSLSRFQCFIAQHLFINHQVLFAQHAFMPS